MAVDGLIIPRSYNDYINKTDPIALSQALKQNNALDDAPTEDSRGGVRSGGVYTALAGKQPTLTFDNTPTDGSSNPVTSDGIYDALAGKQDTLTFDNTPTADSDNPVKSSGLVNSVPVDSVTADNMHSVTSNAVAQKIATIGQFENIYNGDTYDNTSKSLSKSIRNYRFICIGLRTNGEYDYIFIPTGFILNNTWYARTLMGAEGTLVTLPFPYQSTCLVQFPTDTTFKCMALYNNVNWILKVYAIWGVF